MLDVKQYGGMDDAVESLQQFRVAKYLTGHYFGAIGVAVKDFRTEQTLYAGAHHRIADDDTLGLRVGEIDRIPQRRQFACYGCLAATDASGYADNSRQTGCAC